ncbi:tRNA-(MS[2]IO[6]A)-hydroxylase (MiaE) [compost metagenome]
MTQTSTVTPVPTILKAPTDPRWIPLALSHLDQVLVDHAWCEQKAAATAMSLIVKVPENRNLVVSMMHLAHEELSHFERIHKVLEQRGVPLSRMDADPYVKELLKLGRPSGEGHLIDRLLILSLVEARSCERFVLLAKNVPDRELAELYHELSLSEAGHYRLFVNLACQISPREEVMARLEALAEEEVKILARLPITPRMH